MFLVNDSLSDRKTKIQTYLSQDEPVIAVLLAAADCERTMRRAILHLGTTPTAELAHRLGRPRPAGWVAPKPRPPKYGSTIDGYASAWGDEVYTWCGRALKDDVVANWVSLKKAFQLRHDLIHGDTGTVGLGYATKCVETLLGATRQVDEFASAQGYDLTTRLKRRLKPRGSK